MFDILETVNKWLESDEEVALATVVKTWGSAPRQAGAKMGITADAAITGSVSGGCVESAVVGEALDGLEDKKPRLLTFGVSDDTAWEVGLACGGSIAVYVEPLDREWWSIIAEHAKSNDLLATVTVLEGEHAGEKLLISGEGEVVYATAEVPARDDLISAATAAMSGGGDSTRTEVGEYDVLIDIHRLRPRLVIVGGAHVAQALAEYADILGFRVTLIDPRQAFATDERFPNVDAILHSYPDEALKQIGIGPDIYLAVLTHDPKIDDPALITALPANVAYVGVLSSSRTHEKRVRRLTKAGLTDEQIGKIHTPIGIDIGAQTPEEIALCIMAEIVAVRNGAR